MIIKVCGMRDAENILQVERLHPDWMGFIFWPKSSRCVSEFPEYMPVNAKRVGVFVDEDIETVRRIAEDYALDIIQLHGRESAEYAGQLQEWETIKAFNIATPDDLEQTEGYEDVVDYFLFDTRKPPEETGGWHPPGGTGEKFDWSVLTHYHGSTPFLLSGGIGPDDAERIRSFNHPKCIGIDLNSRFELSPALKDVEKLETFFSNLRIQKV